MFNKCLSKYNSAAKPISKHLDLKFKWGASYEVYAVKQDKCFLICENVAFLRTKVYKNLFRSTYDSEKHYLSLESLEHIFKI